MPSGNSSIRGGDAQGEVVPAEGGEAHVGLAAEHGVEVLRVAAREYGGQWPAGDEQGLRQARPDHLRDAQRGGGQADHGIDADDVRAVGGQIGAELLEGAEGAVEHARVDGEPAQLGGEVAAPSGGNSSSVAVRVRKYGNTRATLDMTFFLEVAARGVAPSLR